MIRFDKVERHMGHAMTHDIEGYLVCPESHEAPHTLLTLNLTGEDANMFDFNMCRFVPREIVNVLKELPSLNSSVTMKKVIFNDPATIVYWEDDTKTVVKCQDEEFDKEKGLLAAIAKKVYGNKGNFNNIIKKHCETVANV